MIESRRPWPRMRRRLAVAIRDDRGEVIPNAIIYAIAALIAVALLTAAADYVTGWIGIWPAVGETAP